MAAKKDFHSVDEYIASQPIPAQSVLNQVRTAIRKALPKAEEAISYQIPAYKLHGSAVLYFAGWKQHYSLYPASVPLVAAFQDELAPYKVNKGTIRFPLSEPVPVELIARIAKFRAKEFAQRETAREARGSSARRENVRVPKRTRRGIIDPDDLQPGLRNRGSSRGRCERGLRGPL